MGAWQPRSKRSREEFDAVFRAQPIIQQADVVLVADHGFEAELVGLEPVQLEPAALHLGEEAAREDIIILVVLDEQHPDLFGIVHTTFSALTGSTHDLEPIFAEWPS